jgi:hypothetical protein
MLCMVLNHIKNGFMLGVPIMLTLQMPNWTKLASWIHNMIVDPGGELDYFSEF